MKKYQSPQIEMNPVCADNILSACFEVSGEGVSVDGKDLGGLII